MMPMPVGGGSPLGKLTHLTLSISALQSKDPFLSAKHILVTPSDAHLCVLLTRNDPGGGTMEGIEAPFLNTLKYLHIRGPGAHVCSELFKTKGKALEKIIIEMGERRGLCDANMDQLILHAATTASNHPEMSISIVWCSESLTTSRQTDNIIFKKSPGALNADGTRNWPLVISSSLYHPPNHPMRRERRCAAFVIRSQDQRSRALVCDKNWKLAEEDSKLAADPMEEELEFEELATKRLQKLAEDQWAQYQSNIPYYLC
jgi:hypothetical protein